ncbi:MAG TPA: nitrilase-related carbon-nitrogen hydrolase [Saprospiraceae bacterium]|nr:nitrilase-related carbon-nitrogen hydrolase [Saprospiraceae bacterium]HMP25061.1 nitrilase-related carbon-nitrogen hydrolase [Saprospiraceae bacterium]
MNPYKALALQVTCPAVNGCANRTEAENRMLATIQRLDAQIRASKAFIGPDLRLVVLPEYFLTGFPMGESIAGWRHKACLHPDGPEYAALGELAQRHQIYLSGNAYETDALFPDLYFQVSFIISPAGEVILRYRRLNSMFAPTPHDVWDAYLEAYGYEAVFPVAKTDIGNLACIASEEILYPEIARCLMLRGAEVLLHHTSEVGSPLLTQKNVAKLARAIENMAYVISANSAGIANIDIPFASTDGSSKIIQYEGIVLTEAGPGESMVANATIDIAALRYHRQRLGMSNFIARQRLELYAPTYAQYAIYPVNNLVNKNPDRSHFVQQQQQVIQQLLESLIIYH